MNSEKGVKVQWARLPRRQSCLLCGKQLRLINNIIFILKSVYQYLYLEVLVIILLHYTIIYQSHDILSGESKKIGTAFRDYPELSVTLRPGFHMIVNRIAESYNSSMSNSLQKD